MKAPGMPSHHPFAATFRKGMGMPVGLISGSNLLAVEANPRPPNPSPRGCRVKRLQLGHAAGGSSLKRERERVWLGCNLLRQVPPEDLSHVLRAALAPLGAAGGQRRLRGAGLTQDCESGAWFPPLALPLISRVA